MHLVLTYKLKLIFIRIYCVISVLQHSNNVVVVGGIGGGVGGGDATVYVQVLHTHACFNIAGVR